ncbi:MAG TPA: hypothetical protein PLU75_01015 [Oscillospiraceae bacterium]|nr:hypothetical protein [Oscillospiraceae bacterium]
MKKFTVLIAALACVMTLLAGCGAEQEEETTWDRRPMVMAEGQLYLDTGRQVEAEIDPSAILGTVTSQVDGSEVPAKDGQSNFGCMGAEYAYYEEGLVVKINSEWQFFEKDTESGAESDSRTETVHDAAWLSSLKAADITSVKISLTPPGTETTVTDEALISELVGILNTVTVGEQDDSWKEYNGQFVQFTLTTADGDTATIAAYNPFVVIDGIGYQTEYDPCEELNAFGNRVVPEEYPLDFDGDGTVGAEDFAQSGYNREDFVSQVMSEYGITENEAEKLLNGEISIMCGVGPSPLEIVQEG